MSQNGFVSIEIDGQVLQVERGIPILEAARRNGIEIPTLCDFPGLPAHGSCRLCVVEIAGRRNTPTACTTPVEAGMLISTHSPKVIALRKELIQLLLAEHPSSCLFCTERDHCAECMVTLRKAGMTSGCGSCPKDSQCELQALAEQYEVRQPGYPIRYRMLPVETHDPFFDRDPNLCILCGRCILVCQNLHFAKTLAYSGRGAQALVSTAFQRAHLETSCTFCGSCVEICPTGALTEKTRKWEGLPERATTSTCPFCSLGCQVSLLSKQDRVIGSLPDHQAGAGVLCVNGRFGITELVDPFTRLKSPQQRVGKTWQQAGWEDVMKEAAGKLSACPPDRFEMRISASCTNEDLFVARQFASVIMKSSPLLASTWQLYGSALQNIDRLLRISVPLEAALHQHDADSPVVLCIGLDDLYNQSVVATQLFQAGRSGAKLIHLSTSQAPSRELGWSDVRLPAANYDGVEPLHTLVSLARRLGTGWINELPVDPQVDQAAELLARSGAPVIIVCADALADSQNENLLLAIEDLVQSLDARVAVLPAQCNLSGALRLGLRGATHEQIITQPSGLDVLYLIGEPPVESQNGRPFIISHVMALPGSGNFNGLLFPAAAFSEEHGTIIDYAGRVQTFRPAVPPPGKALPAWKILSAIARQMGAPGFAYNSVEDIWQAAQTEFPGFPTHHAWPATGDSGPASSPDPRQIPGAGWREPHYMGLPLAQHVAGLRSLYSETNHTRAHESNS